MKRRDFLGGIAAAIAALVARVKGEEPDAVYAMTDWVEPYQPYQWRWTAIPQELADDCVVDDVWWEPCPLSPSASVTQAEPIDSPSLSPSRGFPSHYIIPVLNDCGGFDMIKITRDQFVIFEVLVNGGMSCADQVAWLRSLEGD